MDALTKWSATATKTDDGRLHARATNSAVSCLAFALEWVGIRLLLVGRRSFFQTPMMPMSAATSRRCRRTSPVSLPMSR